MSEPVELAVLAAEVRHLREAVEKAEQSHQNREEKLDKLQEGVTDLQTRLTVLENSSMQKDIERLERRIGYSEKKIEKLEVSVWKVLLGITAAGSAGGMVAKVIDLLGG